MEHPPTFAKTHKCIQSAEIVNATRRLKDIKNVMKDIWEETKSYRISDTVHMTEKQILARFILHP